MKLLIEFQTWLFGFLIEIEIEKMIFYLPGKKNDPSSGQAWPNPTEGWCTRWWPPRRRRSPSLRLSEHALYYAWLHLAVERVTKIDYYSENQPLWTTKGKVNTSFLFTSLFELQLIGWHPILVFPLITSFWQYAFSSVVASFYQKYFCHSITVFFFHFPKVFTFV